MKAAKHVRFPSFVIHPVYGHRERYSNLNHIQMSNEIYSKWIFVLHYVPEQTRG